MKTLDSASHALVGVGLAAFGGMYLFGAGSLTVLGWCICLPLFVGGIGLAGPRVVGAISSLFTKTKETVQNFTNKDEKNNIKPGATATA